MAYEFYIYTFLLVPHQQLTLFPRSRKDVIKDLFDNLVKSRRVIFENESGKKHYLLYHNKSISDHFLLFKFAKEREYGKYEADETDIKLGEDKEYPFVYLLVDTVNQIMLVQKKTTVFAKPEYAQTAIKNLFCERVIHEPYAFSLEAKSSNELFWDIVEKSDEIYHLRLVLKSPNLFGASAKASDILQKQKELHNANEIEIGLKNESGKLKLIKESFFDIIEYITAGGGSYILRAKEKASGIVKPFMSKSLVKSINLSLDPKNISYKDLEKIIQGIKREDFREGGDHGQT